jgi:hypothetical protein
LCRERPLFNQTSLTVDGLRVQDHEERRIRYARRNRLRSIDRVLNELELLNLAEDAVVPSDLARRASGFINAAPHSLMTASDRAIPIGDWMTALLEVQDTLMVADERPVIG